MARTPNGPRFVYRVVSNERGVRLGDLYNMQRKIDKEIQEIGGRADEATTVRIQMTFRRDAKSENAECLTLEVDGKKRKPAHECSCMCEQMFVEDGVV